MSWIDRVEGREVFWGGRRWRFVAGVPRDVGPAASGAPGERWASISDAARLYDLRPELIRRAARRGDVRHVRYDGRGGGASPAVYVALDDVARLRPRPGRGPVRTRSVRDELIGGIYTFEGGEPRRVALGRVGR